MTWTYSLSYLHYIPQRHRYSDHNYECPTHCAYNRQLTVRCLDILRHPAKLDHFQPQIGHILEHNSTRISKLIANNMCVIYTPPVITNCSPGVIIKYFNSSFGAPRSSNQSHSWNNFQKKCSLIPFDSHTTLKPSINMLGLMLSLIWVWIN